MPLQIIRQDITKMKVDAIVNTTNSSMIGYSGVDLAIHSLAGPEFDRECEALAPLDLGRAKITRGYALPAKYVIHTSGPTWRGGKYGESEILRSCYVECLKLAVEHKCKTVAFPLISAGVYQFPKDQVLKFAVQTITEFLFEHELTVYICVYDKQSYSISQKLFNDIQAFIDDGYAEECRGDYYLGNRAPRSRRIRGNMPFEEKAMRCESATPISPCDLDGFISKIDMSFGDMLFSLIDERGMGDVECYKMANVDKKTFSKIKCNRKTYKPSKQTAIAFAISLHLDFDTTQKLLATAGFTLSDSAVADKIIKYFIYNKKYDVFEINQVLFDREQTLLGSVKK